METPPVVQPMQLSDDQISEAFHAEAQESLNHEDPQEEIKELVMFDPDHPLVQKHQSTLSRELSHLLEQMKLKLLEKIKTEKEDAICNQELKVKLEKEQACQVKMQKKLQVLNTTHAQKVDKHKQVQEQLQTNTNQHSAVTEKKDTAERDVTQLQAKLDHLMLLTVYAQEECKDIRLQVNNMKNLRHREEVENSQAEEEKRKQDLCVDQLTKELDLLTQEKEKHLGKIIALKEETRESNKSLLKVNMDLEMFLMTRKQMLRQWNNRLHEMQKRDEPLSAKLEDVFKDRQQVILLDEEIDQYKKSTKAQEERGQTLNSELKCYEMDCAELKKRISERQSQQECLQSRHTEKKSVLLKTSETLSALKDDIAAQQEELNKDKKMLDNLISERQAFENKVLVRMEQLPDKDAAQFSLLKKMATLIREKRNRLQLLVSDTNAKKLERHKVNVKVATLELTEKDLQEEIRRLDKKMKVVSADILSTKKMIKQKQVTLTESKTKISSIVSSMANEDLGPLRGKVRALTTDIEALETSLSHDKQLWLKLQEKAIKKVLEMENHNREIFTLQTENTALTQKGMRLDSQIEFEHQVEIELDNTSKKLRLVQMKLNTILGKNKTSDLELERETTVMETELNQRLQEAYLESLNLQMKYENLLEENEQMMVSLLEVEQHIMLWERKAQIVQETNAALNCDEKKEEITAMKVETHRREQQLSVLIRQQEELVTESQKVVVRWSSNLARKELKEEIWDKKQPKKNTSPLVIMTLQRKIKESHTLVDDYTEMVYELHSSRMSLNSSLLQQQQQLPNLYDTSATLDSDILNLQDGKEWDSLRLRTMVTREKKLREIIGNKYKVSTTSERVDAARKKVAEYLHNVGTISSRMCEELPEHQMTLRRFNQELAPYIRQVSDTNDQSE